MRLLHVVLESADRCKCAYNNAAIYSYLPGTVSIYMPFQEKLTSALHVGSKISTSATNFQTEANDMLCHVRVHGCCRPVQDTETGRTCMTTMLCVHNYTIIRSPARLLNTVPAIVSRMQTAGQHVHQQWHLLRQIALPHNMRTAWESLAVRRPVF